MLVLSRKPGEKIVVGDNIVITINKIAGNRVTLGIEAPGDVRIVRGELEPLANARSHGRGPAAVSPVDLGSEITAAPAIAHRHPR